LIESTQRRESRNPADLRRGRKRSPQFESGCMLRCSLMAGLLSFVFGWRQVLRQTAF
jgi:hypothetical protein